MLCVYRSFALFYNRCDLSPSRSLFSLPRISFHYRDRVVSLPKDRDQLQNLPDSILLSFGRSGFFVEIRGPGSETKLVSSIGATASTSAPTLVQFHLPLSHSLPDRACPRWRGRTCYLEIGCCFCQGWNCTFRFDLMSMPESDLSRLALVVGSRRFARPETTEEPWLWRSCLLVVADDVRSRQRRLSVDNSRGSTQPSRCSRMALGRYTHQFDRASWIFGRSSSFTSLPAAHSTCKTFSW